MLAQITHEQFVTARFALARNGEDHRIERDRATAATKLFDIDVSLGDQRGYRQGGGSWNCNRRLRPALRSFDGILQRTERRDGIGGPFRYLSQQGLGTILVLTSISGADSKTQGPRLVKCFGKPFHRGGLTSGSFLGERIPFLKAAAMTASASASGRLEAASFRLSRT